MDPDEPDGTRKIDSIKLISKDGLNRKKTDDYDREALKEIIRHALVQGVDPYLALSISIMEADPRALVAKVRSGSSNDGFGPIHVSSVAAYTAHGLFAGRDRSI